MSESNEHRELVISMVRYLSTQYPNMFIRQDVQERPGDPVPAKIGEFRPDIFAHDIERESCIIGEAKTASDLENAHSQDQLFSFVSHLDQTSENGLFLLGIAGEKADRAKALLWFLSKELDLELARTGLQIFDGLDYWTLCSEGGVRWRLN